MSRVSWRDVCPIDRIQSGWAVCQYYGLFLWWVGGGWLVSICVWSRVGGWYVSSIVVVSMVGGGSVSRHLCMCPGWVDSQSVTYVVLFVFRVGGWSVIIGIFCPAWVLFDPVKITFKYDF